jgi:hypothetical protein
MNWERLLGDLESENWGHTEEMTLIKKWISNHEQKNVGTKIGDYVICRTYSAGVFAGTLAARDDKEVTLTDARRIWYWAGAASLSQLAMEGVKKPKDCKFPTEVKEVILTEAIEILAVTPQAKESIAKVPVWKE